MITLQWEPPTEFADGSLIPPEMAADIITTIYATPQGLDSWAVVGIAHGGTECGVELAPGLWQIRATAKFPDGAESEPTEITGAKVYAALKKVKKLWVLKVTQ